MRFGGRLAHAVWPAAVVLALTSALLAVLNREHAPRPGLVYSLGACVTAIAFSAVGALVTVRRPTNPMGWLLSGLGMAVIGTLLTQGYATYTLLTRPGALPGGHVAGWLGLWMWVTAVVPAGTFLVLLFPDGHLPSPRWRPVAWLAGITLAAAVVGTATVSADSRAPDLEPEISGRTDVVILVVPGTAFAVLAAVSAAAGVTRYRAADEDGRRQLRWFGFSVAVAALAVAAQFVDTENGPDPVLSCLLFLTAGIPVAIGIAIFRYRLYDIDAVIHKTVLYSLLAAFVTAVYLVFVIGVGSLVGAQTGGAVLPSLAATAVAALGFAGVRQRARRLADRVVHGARATPYEALAGLSRRLSTDYSIDEFLPSLAQSLAEVTRARRADVWVVVDGRPRRAASYPPAAAGAEANAGAGFDGDAGTDADLIAEVRGGDRLLGVITLTMPPGVPPTVRDRGLVDAIAAHAAIAFRDVARAAELRESRKRIVTAQDAERRRLERDVHDGAQQRLVALALKVALARRLADTDPGGTRELLGGIAEDAESALTTLRELARGIFPAVLTDRGLAAALREHADVAPGSETPRYAPEVESAVYFCCLEAVQNAAKHAPGASARVRLKGTVSRLEFTVSDTGPGFDPAAVPGTGSGLRNMRDRLEALGGSLEVVSAPGRGTAVRGSVDIPPPA